MRRFLAPALLSCLALAMTAASPAASARAPRMAIGPATAVSPARVAAPGPRQGQNRGQQPRAPEKAATEKPAAGASRGSVFFADSFDRADGLITNDFSHWNPNSAEASASPSWEMTSGSLFARGGEAWTGSPDGCSSASPHSSPCTASAVFRLNTVRHDFGDVTVSLDVVNQRLLSTSRTPAVAWDGIHLWLRYQSEYSLYAVSFNRRDGHLVIKKKCPGGSENGGTYYELGAGELSGFPIPFGAAQRVAATVANGPGGTVVVSLSRNGSTLISATDSGLGCAPITAPGAIGVRGDNDEFSFDDLAVSR
jgi:hypothetical protein